MDDAILPLHAVPKQQVTEYLGRRGMTSEIVEWKYYDDHFNRAVRNPARCSRTAHATRHLLPLIPPRVSSEVRSGLSTYGMPRPDRFSAAQTELRPS